MNAWLALGVFLLGAGAGALLTAISYSGRLRKLKADIKLMKKQSTTQHEDAA